MALNLKIDDQLTFRLEEEAEARGLPVLQLVRSLLEQALAKEEAAVTPEDVVSRIRREAPPHPLDRIADASGDHTELLETLLAEPIDPSFDLATWQKEWDAAEAEIRRIDRMNDWAEGRR